MFHLLFHRSSFFTVATRRCRCLLRCQGVCYAWTVALCDLGDPGWGDPWFPLWAVLLFALLPGPVLCFFVFSVLLIIGGQSQWHTSCHHACRFHCWLHSHSSVSVWFVLVVVLWFFVFDGIAHWTLYWSITSSFEAADLFDGLACQFTIQLFCCGWTCVTTWRKPWRRWKEKMLEVFLVVAEFAGFRAGGRLPVGWLHWISTVPCWLPLAPSRLPPSFQSGQKLLIHSINLKRDGFRIC